MQTATQTYGFQKLWLIIYVDGIPRIAFDCVKIYLSTVLQNFQTQIKKGPDENWPFLL